MVRVMNDFSEGLAVISLNGKYGYIDKTGMIVKPQFDSVKEFENGFASVRLGKWGVIKKPNCIS